MKADIPKLKINQKIKNNNKSIGILDATKDNSINLRMKTKAVLLTGGLLVRKEGYIYVKKEGFGKNYKRKYVILEEGVLKIFDCIKGKDNKIIKPQPKNLIISSAQRKEVVDRDRKAELLIEVGKLKSIEYIKRNGKVFEITWRPSKNRKSYRSIGEQSQGSRPRYSTLSRAMGVNRNRTGSDSTKSRGSQRHFSLLNPLTWAGASEKTVHFRVQEGNIADEWVQSILYELKNQAVCIGQAITTQENMQYSRNTTKLDNLHRLHVDLWALAKGKISNETKGALEGFVDFLENHSVQPAVDDLSIASSEELTIWKATLDKVTELIEAGVNTIDTGHEVGSALEEIQILNEESYHIGKGSLRDFQTFRTTKKILNPENEAIIRNRQTGSFLNHLRRNRKVSKTTNIELSLDDIIVLRPEMRQKTAHLQDSFPSALDVKQENDKKAEAKLLASFKENSSSTKGMFLEQQTNSDI